MKNEVFILIFLILSINTTNIDYKLVKMYQDKTNLKNFSLNYWNNKMILFGGCFLNDKCSNKIYIFGFNNEILQEIEATGNVPSERSGHSAIIYGNDLIIYGGSNRFGVLGDLYVLNLILFEWKKIEFSGFTPKPRAFHTSNLDKNLRMIVFGGYKFSSLTNDILIYDLRKNEWLKPIISGKLPLPRQNHSSTVIDNNLYIFGGYTNGSLLNDLAVFNINDSKWMDVKINGDKPEKRQNSVMQGTQKEIFISGGCDYSKGKCFSDMWDFNLIKMEYKLKFNKSKFDINIGNSIIKGPVIYYMGGCWMNSFCNSKILKYNTTVTCPNNCSNKGLCNSYGECNCNKLNFGNDCSYSFKCLENCSKNAFCGKDGKCKCFPGYTGRDCSTILPCKNNCTDHLHGICLGSGICNCRSKWSGDDCSKKFNITNSNNLNVDKTNNLLDTKGLTLSMFGYPQYEEKVKDDYKNFYEKYEKLNKCKNSCNYRGFCQNKKCYCRIGYFGKTCSLTNDISNSETYKYLFIYIGVGLLIGILIGGLYSFIFNRIKKQES